MGKEAHVLQVMMMDSQKHSLREKLVDWVMGSSLVTQCLKFGGRPQIDIGNYNVLAIVNREEPDKL